MPSRPETRLHLTLDEALIAALRAEAANRQCSLPALVSMIATDWLGRSNTSAPPPAPMTFEPHFDRLVALIQGQSAKIDSLHEQNHRHAEALRQDRAEAAELLRQVAFGQPPFDLASVDPPA